ncbi:MAG: hypothetical protein MJE77_15340, partial [Proteobacteria bacterium]|nr:hypothetical protein [Pseudomonadota bacterium]
LGPSQSDEARRQWVGEEWRILGVFDRRASPLAVMDRRSGDAESFWTGSKPRVGSFRPGINRDRLAPDRAVRRPGRA